jgi:predicted dienelactone hydrolase
MGLAAVVVLACGGAKEASEVADAVDAVDDVAVDAADATPVEPCTPREWGPHGVGVTTLDLVDPQRGDRPLPTLVYYPSTVRIPPETCTGQYWQTSPGARYASAAFCATPDAPPDAAGGPYPVVLFSHGSGSHKEGHTYLLEYLAARGYVVAAVDHTGNVGLAQSFPADLQMTITRALDVHVLLDLLLARFAAADGPLAGLGDPDRVGVMGHSWGGHTTMSVAGLTYAWDVFARACEAGVEEPVDAWFCPLYEHRDVVDGQFRDPRLKAAVALAQDAGHQVAGPHCRGAEGISIPLMLVLGDHDAFVETDLDGTDCRDHARGPACSVLLKGAGHRGFTDAGNETGVPSDERMVDLVRGYVAAFFDRHLKELTSCDEVLATANEAWNVGFDDHEAMCRPARTEPACGDGARDPGEACDGGTVACDTLGASFAGGQASCRKDCSGYDVAGCALAADPDLWEAVTPALRDPARWGDARCNDGTPFTFRVRLSATGSRDWVIALRGGGLCDDVALPCWTRSKELTTAIDQADRERFVPDDKNDGVFSRDAAVNPGLAEANHVFGPYCSSDAWTGVRTERAPTTGSPDGWYFAGRRNAQALIQALVAGYGLDDRASGTRVLFAGESAGCVGALVNTDLVAAALPVTTAAGRLRVELDAAWLPSSWADPEAPLGLAKQPDLQTVRAAFDFWGGEASAACTAGRLAAGGHPGDCLFGDLGLPYLQDPAPAGLGLRVLVQQSLQDEELLTFHGLLDDPEGIAAYAAAIVDAAADVRWLFAADQPYHSTIFKPELWSLGTPGATLGEVMARFWSGGEPERVIVAP